MIIAKVIAERQLIDARTTPGAGVLVSPARFISMPSTAQFATSAKNRSLRLKSIHNAIPVPIPIIRMAQTCSLMPNRFHSYATSRAVTLAIVATVIQPK